MARNRAENVEIGRSDDDILAVRGVLTFATSGRAFTEGRRILTAGAQTRLDLADVTHADSAGLACVIALVAAANRSGRRLRITGWPEGLRALAEVCDVATLLEPETQLA
jgi:phospholipid transport system transporter-binding protein